MGIQIGWNGKDGTTADLAKYPPFAQLDPVFRSRLLRLFAAAGGRLGFGEGFRSAEQQAAGAARKPGVVAPQGKSWHEVGMAADLSGDLAWLDQNAAKFGLKTFANVNNEPWHVQPIDIPNARPQGAPAPRIDPNAYNSGGFAGNPDAYVPGSGGSSSSGPSGGGAPGAVAPDSYHAGASSGGASVSAAAPMTLPPDATVYRNEYGMFALFDVGGVKLFYDIPWQDGTVSWDESKVVDAVGNGSLFEGAVAAGSALELSSVTVTFGSFQQMWDSILGQVMGYNNPARHDPGVLKVIAEFAARPDMEPAELQNKLQATEWYQRHTEGELEWNSLSEAERAKRLQETEARMIATVFQFAGERVNANDPRVKNYLEKVSSGALGLGAYTEIIKGLAVENAESPWSRQVRDEQEEQRKRPIDIENTSQRVREATERWGIQWSDATIQQWGKGLVDKTKSDEDLMKALRDQANVLYGAWKDPEIETQTAAAPWLETYRRVMEKQGSLTTPEVQAALTGAKAPWEFEQELKKKDGWMGTKNGQASVYSTISEMGRRMGFE